MFDDRPSKNTEKPSSILHSTGPHANACGPVGYHCLRTIKNRKSLAFVRGSRRVQGSALLLPRFQLLPRLGAQHLLAHAYRLRGDLHQLVVVDELHGLLQRGHMHAGDLQRLLGGGGTQGDGSSVLVDRPSKNTEKPSPVLAKQS